MKKKKHWFVVDDMHSEMNFKKLEVESEEEAIAIAEEMFESASEENKYRRKMFYLAYGKEDKYGFLDESSVEIVYDITYGTAVKRDSFLDMIKSHMRYL